MDTQNTFCRLNRLSVRLISLFVVGVFYALQSTTALAEIPVAAANDGQLFPLVVDDGKGGVIVVWEDYRTGKDWDVYAQRVDNTNTTVWAPNGLALSTADGNQRRLRMIRHDTHAIVIWNDRRGISSWDIYAQAVDFEGKVLWEKDGIPICTNAADQTTQAILSDGEGGAIIVWTDERKSSEFHDLYMQRINSEGTPMWERDGIPVFPSKTLHSNSVLIADGLGGFYVVWWDVVGYDAWHIMAYRFNFDAKPMWDAPRLVSPGDGMQGEPRVIADGKGGIIVVWQIYEDFINDQLYAQRISPDGNRLWQDAGIPICTADGIQKHAAIVNDGEGGIIAVWRDERDIYSDLYAQRIRADGTLVWEKDGIPICVVGGHQNNPFIVQTAEKRFFVAWLDFREDFGEKRIDAIYCQKIDLDGNLLWEEDGVPISTSKGEHGPPVVVSVDKGELCVVWSNNQRDNGDIFFKRF